MRRFRSFRKKLLAAFGGIGILVMIMLLLGNQIAGVSIKQFTQVISDQVEVLASANDLHLRIGRLRLVEIELPSLTDYFAVVTEIQSLKKQIEEFQAELDRFEAQQQHASSEVMRSIRSSWNLYQKDLQTVIRHATSMEMAEASRVSTYQSDSHFKNIQRLLQTVTNSMKQAVRAAYLETEAEQQQLRSSFTFVSLLGLFIGILFVLLFARSLSIRVTSLRDAAERLSQGHTSSPIHVDGDDELTNLADAFNQMQKQIQTRERALKEAHDTLEMRVESRTQELNQSNLQLQQEMEERQRVEISLKLLSQAMEQSPVGVFIADIKGRIDYVNDAFVKNTGYSSSDLTGESFLLLIQKTIPRDVARELIVNMNAGMEWHGEVEVKLEDGSLEWMSLLITPVKNAAQQITHFLAIKEDVTVRKQQEAKILYQAQFDSLTDLPNRALAMDRLSQIIATAERHESKVVLMFLDLDDFKKINDSLGHEMGDKLLMQAAARLRKAVRKNDTVARQGGDEFLVILGGLAAGADAEPVLENILKAFNRSFLVDGHDLVVTPSIGLAVYPDDGDDPSRLLRHADLAMYQAKEDGRNTFHFYNQMIHDYSLQRLELERELRHALDRDEMELYYQPLIDIKSRQLMGAEALMRWNSRAFGLVSPSQFIGLAEQTGLIVQLGEWAMQHACQQACLWQNLLPDFLLSINVSPRQFRGSFITGTIQRSLERSMFPARQLQVEVTEGLLIRNNPEVQEALTTLDRMGVRLAMDDFGTGYSSLSYLKNFPFHTLKIDRSFINDMTEDPNYRTIVSAAISMGKALGLSLVAEGVETEEQLAILTEEGCETAQGFLFGKPIPAAEFSDCWMEKDEGESDEEAIYGMADR
ncbi:EAL domain-containing protein [Sedimenticola sp.]|uniref:EAL domain-containing protein n=1 Tax=Sedimenticola sp. TaxID=1940285 RepID=UPI003D13176E